MASLADFHNLTPHPIHIYQAGGKTPVVTIPCHGVLRLRSQPQVPLKPVAGGIPLITGQRFVGIEKGGAGYKLWNDHPTGHFIVSLPMAQYLTGTTNGREETGARLIYCPATGPGNDVREDDGKIKGTLALEYYD